MKVKEYTFPNGIVISDIPADISEADFATLYERVMASKPMEQEQAPDAQLAENTTINFPGLGTAKLPSGVVNPLIAMGGEFAKIGQNAARLGKNVGNFLDPRKPFNVEQHKQNVADIDKALQPIKEANPVSSFIAQAAPYVAATAPLGVGYGAATAAGGLSGLLGASGEGDQAKQGLAGGILGIGGQFGANRLNTIFKPWVKEAQGYTGELVKKAKDLGYKLTQGAKTGSRFIQQADARLARSPLLGTPFSEIEQVNQALSNKIAAKSFGQSGTELTPKLLDDAHTALGLQFDDIYKGKNIPYTPEIKQSLIELDKVSGGLVGNIAPGKQMAGRMLGAVDATTNTIPGTEVQKLLTQVKRVARSKAHSNPELSGKLFDVLDNFETAVKSQLPAESQHLLRQVNQQYRNLMNVEDSLTGANIDFYRLGNYLKQRDNYGFVRGKNTSDLYTTAHIAQNINLPGLKPVDHGASIIDPMTALSLGLAVGGKGLEATGLLGVAKGLEKLYMRGAGTTGLGPTRMYTPAVEKSVSLLGSRVPATADILLNKGESITDSLWKKFITKEN